MNQEKIGKFISTLRKEKNMTQQELASKIGVTDRAIGNWENGRRLPDYSILLDLCNELGITINELLSGEKIQKDDYLKEAEKNLIELRKQIDKKRKIFIIFRNICAFILIGLFIFNMVLNYIYRDGWDNTNLTDFSQIILIIYCISLYLVDMFEFDTNK